MKRVEYLVRLFLFAAVFMGVVYFGGRTVIANQGDEEAKDYEFPESVAIDEATMKVTFGGNLSEDAIYEIQFGKEMPDKSGYEPCYFHRLPELKYINKNAEGEYEIEVYYPRHELFTESFNGQLRLVELQDKEEVKSTPYTEFTYTKSNKVLETPKNIRWEDPSAGKAVCDKVENIYAYVYEYYVDGEKTGSKFVYSTSDNSVIIPGAKQGDGHEYTFRVRALSRTAEYAHSEFSEMSPDINDAQMSQGENTFPDSIQIDTDTMIIKFSGNPSDGCKFELQYEREKADKTGYELIAKDRYESLQSLTGEHEIYTYFNQIDLFSESGRLRIRLVEVNAEGETVNETPYTDFVFTKPSNVLAVPSNLRWDAENATGSWDVVEGAFSYYVELFYEGEPTGKRWWINQVENANRVTDIKMLLDGEDGSKYSFKAMSVALNTEYAHSGWSELATVVSSGDNSSGTTQGETHTSHIFGEWNTVRASTTTEKGLAIRKCMICGQEETKELDMLVAEPAPEQSNVLQQQVEPQSTTVLGQKKEQDIKENLDGIKLSAVKTAKSKTFSVSWTKINDADGYEVMYAQNKKFTKAKKTKKTSKTGLTVKKLKRGKTYYIRVRAIKKIMGGKSLYGAWSKVRRIKVS